MPTLNQAGPRSATAVVPVPGVNTVDVSIAESFVGDTIQVLVCTADKTILPTLAGYTLHDSNVESGESGGIFAFERVTVLADVPGVGQAMAAHTITVNWPQNVQGVVFATVICGKRDATLPAAKGFTSQYGNTFSVPNISITTDGSYATQVTITPKFPRDLTSPAPYDTLGYGRGTAVDMASGLLVGQELDAGNHPSPVVRARDPDPAQAGTLDSDAVHGTLFATLQLLYLAISSQGAVFVQGEVDITPVIDMTDANQVGGAIQSYGTFLSIDGEADVTVDRIVGTTVIATVTAQLTNNSWFANMPDVAPGNYIIRATVTDGPRNAQVSHTSLVTVDREIPITLSSNVVADDATNGTFIGAAIALPLESSDAGALTLADNAGGRFAFNYDDSPSTRRGLLSVANATLLDAAQATTHDITMRYTDDTGFQTNIDFPVTVVTGTVVTPPPAPTPAPAPVGDVVFQPIPTRAIVPLPPGASAPWPAPVDPPGLLPEAQIAKYLDQPVDPKYFDEMQPYVLDFDSLMTSGETVAFADRELIVRGDPQPDNGDPKLVLNTENMLVGDPTIYGGRYVVQWIIGGQLGYAYTLRVKITTSRNRAVYAELSMRVYASASRRAQRLDQ